MEVRVKREERRKTGERRGDGRSWLRWEGAIWARDRLHEEV